MLRPVITTSVKLSNSTCNNYLIINLLISRLTENEQSLITVLTNYYQIKMVFKKTTTTKRKRCQTLQFFERKIYCFFFLFFHFRLAEGAGGNPSCYRVRGTVHPGTPRSPACHTTTTERQTATVTHIHTYSQLRITN